MEIIVITDASVLINLAASEMGEEILSDSGLKFQVCPDVLNEVKVLRDRETGEEHVIDLDPHFAKGCLTLIAPETEPEFELLVDYAALLGRGDGEAMCFALAQSRGHAVAIDDDRAIKRAKKNYPEFKTVGTIEILIAWQERNAVTDDRLGKALLSIVRFARYRPSTSHPRYEWWDRFFPKG